METFTKKLLLIPVEYGKKKLVVEETVFVRVNEASGTIGFGRLALQEMAMDNKLYRLFYDEAKCVVAWQLKDGLSKDEMDSKTWKLVKASSSNGAFVISVKRVLEVLGRDKSSKSYKATVKKYLMKNDLMQDGDYYFIDLAEAASLAGIL